jgi:hypothetical protein
LYKKSAYFRGKISAGEQRHMKHDTKGSANLKIIKLKQIVYLLLLSAWICFFNFSISFLFAMASFVNVV